MYCRYSLSDVLSVLGSQRQAGHDDVARRYAPATSLEREYGSVIGTSKKVWSCGVATKCGAGFELRVWECRTKRWE